MIFFGIRQSGELDFSLADIYQDAPVIELVQQFLDKMTKEEFRQRIHENAYLSSQVRPASSSVTL